MGIFSLLLPRKCRFCGKKLMKNDRALCPVCRGEYESAKRRVCQKCKRQYLECNCRAATVDRSIIRFVSLFRYKKNTPGGALILSLKDRRDKEALGLLAGDMAKALKRAGVMNENCAVTFVPRSPKAKREKGVDQSYELARRIGETLGLPLYKALKAESDRQSQKELSFKERAERASHLYKPTKNCAALRGKRVILIDDVCTTGATVSSCAAALAAAGAADVVVLTAGRA